MSDYPAATCPKCNAKIGHPGPCPNCYSHTGTAIQRAIEIATDVHRNQYRKGGCKPPYIIHPIAVLNRMLRWGIVEPMLLTATPLHDAKEDGDDPDQIVLRIREHCGPVVLEYVEEMTCVGDKAAYMESFKTKSIGALLMKMADRLCNVDDFFNDESTQNYAGKYLRKADPVFDAFINRKDECVEKYGEEVWKSAFYDFKQTATYLGANIQFYRQADKGCCERVCFR
jgi:hypothetical protein